MGLDATVYADDDCEDELASVRIGNVVHVGALCGEVAALEGDYPLILGWVLYSGSHCGDQITAQEVGALQAELRRLPEGPDYVGQFRAELLRLCEVALEHGRPITF